MKVKTNSPTVLGLVMRLLTQRGIALKKVPTGNELIVIDESVDEGHIRLVLQEELDKVKFDFDDDFVLVNGNSVWSYDRIMNEIKSIKKADNTDGITGYFYRFMHLNFTVAYGSMRGWMVEHPTFDVVIQVFDEKNVPGWKTDVLHILRNVYKMKENALN